MKDITELSKNAFNKYIYDVRSHGICFEDYADGDIVAIREQMFSIFINRLLTAKGMSITDKLSELLTYLNKDCWGYLYAYNNNIGSFATMLNYSSTIAEFANVLSCQHHIIEECMTELRENYFVEQLNKTPEEIAYNNELIEYESIYDIMYDVLINIENVALCNKPVDELENDIYGFVSDFNIDVENDIDIAKSYFVCGGKREEITADKLIRLIDLLAFCSTYPEMIDKIWNECKIESANDLLDVLKVDTVIEIDDLIENEKAMERYRNNGGTE